MKNTATILANRVSRIGFTLTRKVGSAGGEVASNPGVGITAGTGGDSGKGNKSGTIRLISQ